MSDRTVEVHGQPWTDGSVCVDQDGTVWQLRFEQHWWGPVHDRWVWLQFGSEARTPLDSEEVKHPLTKIWPPDAPAEKPVSRRRVPDIEPDPRSGKKV